jgi:type I restriction enzyme M protein
LRLHPCASISSIVATLQKPGTSAYTPREKRSAGAEDDDDFASRLAELHDEFTVLSDEAELLRGKVDAAVEGILEA